MEVLSCHQERYLWWHEYEFIHIIFLNDMLKRHLFNLRCNGWIEGTWGAHAKGGEADTCMVGRQGTIKAHGGWQIGGWQIGIWKILIYVERYVVDLKRLGWGESLYKRWKRLFFICIKVDVEKGWNRHLREKSIIKM
jgi:hypothetical protein